MSNMFEHGFVRLFNRLKARRTPSDPSGLRLGRRVVDGKVTDQYVAIPAQDVCSHIFTLGVTGVGKTRHIENLIAQAIHKLWGVVVLIPHPDLFPFFLGTVAEFEHQTGHLFSDRTPIINLPDRQWATGLNLLEVANDHELFVLAAELAEMIRVRFDLDSIGVRILELLRNTVFVLASTGNTLMEFRLFLNNAVYRASLLRQIDNAEVKAYFTEHYDRLSLPEQSMYAAALLNKISELTADPLIAHVIGQRHSAMSLVRVLDDTLWLAFNADKAVLREQGATLLALFFVRLKNAVFARTSGRLSLVVCDEVHNLLVHDSGLELALSECRKYRTGFVTATQTLDQLTAAARAAMLGCHTQCFFRLAAPDAEKIAGYLDGGRHLAERLKCLPRRRMIVKIGERRFEEVEVPNVAEPTVQTADLYRRIMQRWARPRAEVEQEIRTRHAQFTRGTTNALRDWE